MDPLPGVFGGVDGIMNVTGSDQCLVQSVFAGCQLLLLLCGCPSAASPGIAPWQSRARWPWPHLSEWQKTTALALGSGPRGLMARASRPSPLPVSGPPIHAQDDNCRLPHSLPRFSPSSVCFYHLESACAFTLLWGASSGPGSEDTAMNRVAAALEHLF